MRRFFFSFVVVLFALVLARPARADKVAVLPFTSPVNVPRPELEQVRSWTRDAVTKRGHTFATTDEMVSAEAQVKDGIADTSAEYLAAAKAVSAQWALVGRVERIDHPSAQLPNGTEEEGYTTYRLELEACQATSSRVESLSREILPDEATPAIAEMLALLLRPEGIANAPIPWERNGLARPKPKPKPAPPPPPPPPPAPPKPRLVYGEGHPFLVGASIGVTTALVRPDQARGPSGAVPVGGVLGYALDFVPGLEARVQLTSQVVGPQAVEVSAGARYALAPIGGAPIFLGPELLLGVQAPLGANQAARFLAHPGVFVAWGIAANLQVEIAGDLVAALGGAGTLVLGGGTARVSARF